MFRKMEIRVEESESQITILGVIELKAEVKPAKFNALENILRERKSYKILQLYKERKKKDFLQQDFKKKIIPLIRISRNYRAAQNLQNFQN